MFEGLNKKINFQSQNEKQLFDNVRNTIYLSFEKSEKIQVEMKSKISELNQRIEKFKKEIYDCKDDYHENKRKLSLKIVNLKNELERLYKENETLKMNISFLKNEKSESQKRINGQIQIHRDNEKGSKIINQKFRKEIKDCNDKLIESNKKYEELKKKEYVLENQDNLQIKGVILRLEEEIQKNKIELGDRLNSEILKGDKLKNNIKLINRKIITIIDKLPPLEKSGNNEILKPKLLDLAQNSYDLSKFDKEIKKTKKIDLEKRSKESNFPNNPNFVEITMSGKKEKISSRNLTEKINIFYDNFVEKNKENSKIIDNLDILLFHNLHESRLLYKKINLIGGLLVNSIKKNNECENKLKDFSIENIGLKQIFSESHRNIKYDSFNKSKRKKI